MYGQKDRDLGFALRLFGYIVRALVFCFKTMFYKILTLIKRLFLLGYYKESPQRNQNTEN
jgi:hypothetical protein